ncbi:uncharacterized protein [Miscanthus floridulus]|uniref:uncharacterized protein isoform X2 n=1 Tax=Miscanthus floridulus TaxID=154761 RepID=UPI003459453B
MTERRELLLLAFFGVLQLVRLPFADHTRACSVAVLHRHQLRRSGRQPPAAVVHRASPPVHNHHQGAPLRDRPGHRLRVRRHGHLAPPRRHQRRHRQPRVLARRRSSLGRRAPAGLVAGRLYRLRRQRGPLRGRLARLAARPGHAEPVRRAAAQLQRQGLHRERHGRARELRPALLGRVQAGARGGARPTAGVPEQDRLAVPYQSVPLLRVPQRPTARDAGLLPVPAQRRPAGRRVRAHVHQHVRRAGRRRARRAGRQGVQGRGDRGGRDRVAAQGRPRRGRRHGGERARLRVGPRVPPQLSGRHAARTRQVGGDVHLCHVRRGPQARQGVGALLRAVPDQPHRDISDGVAQERHGRTDTSHGADSGANDVRPSAKANARAAATGDSRAAGLDGGSWAFRPLHAGARDGYVERDHHHCLRSS